MDIRLTEEQREILSGRICPYCHVPTEYKNSIEVYGVDYGMIYYCPQCGAYVGVHKGTDRAGSRNQIQIRMSSEKRNKLSEIFKLAWQFVKRNGYKLSEALKCAWLNIKLKAEMKKRIVKFYFQKIDGSLREAYGTTNPETIPATTGNPPTRYKRISIQKSRNTGVSKKLI